MMPQVEKLIGVAAANAAANDPSYVAEKEIWNEFKLDGRVGVVTGGNGGLGLEFALCLIEAGAAHVYCMDINAEASQDFIDCQRMAATFKSTMTYVQCDVTDASLVKAVFEQIATVHGRLDVTVCAAGILGPAAGIPCEDYPPAIFKKVIDINTNGVFYCAQAAAKVMKNMNCTGSIILIASMSGSITNRDHKWVAYNTSKAAVIQMARSMACELGVDGIRVNSLSPGHISTKMTRALLDVDPAQGEVWANSNPLGRLGNVHELRGSIAWLASDASTFCTGSDIIVSGGHHSW